MSKLSLRTKLAVWSSLIVTAILLVVCGFTALYLYLEQLEAMDERLKGTAKHFVQQFKQHDSDLAWIDNAKVVKIFHPEGTPDRFLEIVHDDGTLIYRSENLGAATFPAIPKGFSYVPINQFQTRAFKISAQNLSISFAMDMYEISHTTVDLILAYLASFPILFAMIYFGGRLIASKALEPIRKLSEATKQINAHDLELRLPAPVVHDEIGQLTEVLNEMLNRLNVSFKQASRFSADASHELKTPLTILRSGIEDLLRRKSFPEDDQNSLSILMDQTTRLSSIIENLLLLSRMDARLFKFDFQLQNVSEILAACEEDARIMAEGRDLEIVTELPEKIMAPVDESRLTQIVLNLLENAIKYNRPQGKIILKTHSENQQCIISVANTSPAQFEVPGEHLFERFYRAEHTTTESGQGLGLSLARELTRAHGGELKLVQSDGQWTIFTITLPLNQPQP